MLDLIDIVVGTRPNFVKAAALIHELNRKKKGLWKFNYRIVHTGQHYDDNLSNVFFSQLGIPEPDVNLSVGSGSQAKQTADIMVAYENLLFEKKSSLCVVFGDVNSTVAAALVAKKMLIKVAHIEAGIRSRDQTMPEEINRIVTDSITDYFFTTTEQASTNLRESGVAADRVFFVGNTMIDTLLTNVARFSKPVFFDSLKLLEKKYILLTLHRPANVDDPIKLAKILNTIMQAANGIPILFVVHPRTRHTINSISTVPSAIKMVEAQPYLNFNFLLKNAHVVISDSGGVSEEATVLDVPCLTMRNSTERPETVVQGTNELVGDDEGALIDALHKIHSGNWKSGVVPKLWDGKAAKRICEILETLKF